MQTASISVRNLSRTFGTVKALNDVNFDIADGEFCVILGASGSGKTTLLNLLAGLDKQTTGDVLIDGKVVNDKDPKSRGIAMVFQDYALYPHMTVYGNMAFPLKMARMQKNVIDSKVKNVASQLSIEQLLQRKPRELSGGQAQRVAVGRALVRDPSVFLMDEPLSNLDAKIRSQVRTDLKVLHRELKKTFVYVTHDQQEAMSLSDKIILIDNGSVSQIGSPLDVYNSPANITVATFLGDPPTNIFKAHAEKGVFISDLSPLKIATDRERIKIGIRPEAFQLEGGPNCAYADLSVITVESFGSHMIVTCETESKATVKIRISNRPFKENRLRVYVQPSFMHLFDDSDGKRLLDVDITPAAAPR